MRSPENVLESLKSKACNKSYKYERLYRNLYNPQFYLLAYQRIQAKPGNMTAGTDGKTIDGMGMARINALIEKMRDFSYQPNPARRTYIPKSNGKMRPLGIPSFDDKLIQEVVRLILESIYEPTFSDYSHGFRINKSCQTALKYVQKYFTGTKWFVEGDIKGCFDNVDHHVLIDILRKRIADEHFIGLLWKFLKAGYMEDWNYHNTYSGTPQGSIISPILANIYSRMFGYDRDPGLMRVYIDENLYKLFSDINATNNSIISQIERGIEDIKVYYPNGLNPTRKNVLDTDHVEMLSGGTNYYPYYPDNDSIDEISKLLEPFTSDELYYQVSLRIVKEVLSHIIPSPDFKLKAFVSVIDTILSEQPAGQGILIVRRNRDVAQGTGALLSPNDWKLGSEFSSKVVLTMYQVTGNKGWGGRPLWVPNIKLPGDIIYYDVIEEN